MGKKCDLSDFNLAIVFGTKRAGVSVSETAFSRLYTELVRNAKKRPVSRETEG